jgi:steroid Delta-isomerase
MAAVGANDRAAWLAAFAEDAVLYDPVGGSPLDPDGRGLRDTAAREQLWDLAIAPNAVRFHVAAAHPAGDEVAMVATVTIDRADGKPITYDGVFVYTVNSDGQIKTVRSYFDLQAALAP